MDTQAIIEWGGFLIITLLVLSETGLLLGLAIPGGETLVFTAGLLSGTAVLDTSVTLLLPALVLAAFLGDLCGFFIGKRIGKKLYKKEDTWWFRKKYLYMAEDFIHRHKRKSLIIGKFLPVIRPFTPVMSGMTNVSKPQFFSISALGCVLYIAIFGLAGYFLGNQFPQIKDYIWWILPISITVAIITVVFQAKKFSKQQDA